jgi:hypothetical protein
MYSIPKPKMANLKKEIINENTVSKPKFGIWTLEDQNKAKMKAKKEKESKFKSNANK